MDLEKLCTNDFYAQVCSHYGYRENFQEEVEKEFSRRTKGVTYLDHAAATLYPESAVQNYCQDISSNLYGNPHSHNPSSKLTHDTVERVRYRVHQHFNTTPEEYTVIFTSGSTGALKLVAECFPWCPGSVFSYLSDSHTSVVGIRGLTSSIGVASWPVLPQDIESQAKNATQSGDSASQTPHLFSFPAQSNFSGKKYPLGYVQGIQARTLYPASERSGRWFVLLDAASFVSSSALNLKECQADFIPISFYKIFGFPTGLGALLVRSNVAQMLKKSYFGGGTAAAYLSGEDYYVQAKTMSDRFEDGTINFLDIIALNHSFNALYKLTGGMQFIQQHTFGLARYTYIILSSLRHGNGQPVANIYTEGHFESPLTQGPILNFNLQDPQGHIVGYSQVDRMASLYNIHLRTGCFCNTGACQDFLGISNQQMKRNLKAGHVCGDSLDLVDGQPTGSVRVSFGYMSTFEDCQKFLNFIVQCFTEKPVTVDAERIEMLRNSLVTSTRDLNDETEKQGNGKEEQREEEERPTEETLGGYGLGRNIGREREEKKGYTLANIYIYPIKSCGAYEVHDWPLGAHGLLYDRGWMVVNGNGVCMSQKREPRLCLIHPEIQITSNQLLLQAPGMEAIFVPLETKAQSEVCQSKVCGDRVETVDCGEEAADWLTQFLGQTCRLIRLSPDFTRDTKKKSSKEASSTTAVSSPLSLVNQAQYLMINLSSVNHIQQLIHTRQEDLCQSEHSLLDDVQNVMKRFRANLVLAGSQPFEEDNWTHLIIGHTRFVVSGQCGRCHMIGIDQDSGVKTKEPLLSLSAFRNKGKVTFGVYLSHQLPKDSNTTSFLTAGSSVLPYTNHL